MAQTRTIAWRASLDDALHEAQQAGKPVLLDFFSPK